MPHDRYGPITPERARLMAQSFKESLLPDEAAGQIAILDLLTIKPVRASAAAADTEPVDDELASLWPPRTAAEADRRERIAASARSDLDDDDLYRAIFGDTVFDKGPAR